MGVHWGGATEGHRCRPATRLISRTRYRHGKGYRSALAGGPALLEPVSSVMTKKMLRVIKGLVEEAGH